MAILWQPIATGFNRNLLLGSGSTETLLYVTDDLPTQTNADGDVITSDLPQDIEETLPIQLGDPHPNELLRARGLICKGKRLVLGPANGRAVVAVTWGTPNAFGAGSAPRTGTSIRVESRPMRWPKVTFFPRLTPVQPGVPDALAYEVEEVEGPERAVITRVTTKPVSLPQGGADALNAQIVPNYGKWYVFLGIPYFLKSHQLLAIVGTNASLRYEFESYGQTIARPADAEFQVAIPPLGYLEVLRWRRFVAGSGLPIIYTEPYDTLYAEGGTLP